MYRMKQVPIYAYAARKQRCNDFALTCGYELLAFGEEYKVERASDLHYTFGFLEAILVDKCAR